MNNIVYKIVNKNNNRFYIGSTQHKSTRMKTHFRLYDMSWRQNNDLHKDIKLYGEHCFDIIILHETYDIIEASRIESKIIRENKGNKLMYNTMQGASGRRVFYESDIIFIRKLYNEKKLYITEAYDLYYKDIVTFRAFKKVWHGDTFKDIYYHVYNKENKKFHFAKGQSRPGSQNGRSKLKEKDVINIRRRRDVGENASDVYEDYKIISKTSFYDIWKDKKWTYLIN